MTQVWPETSDDEFDEDDYECINPEACGDVCIGACWIEDSPYPW